MAPGSAYSAVVIGALTALVVLTGRVDLTATDWTATGRNFLLMSATGTIAIILTEEGFFRGWLWASLNRDSERDPGRGRAL